MTLTIQNIELHIYQETNIILLMPMSPCLLYYTPHYLLLLSFFLFHSLPLSCSLFLYRYEFLLYLSLSTFHLLYILLFFSLFFFPLPSSSHSFVFFYPSSLCLSLTLSVLKQHYPATLYNINKIFRLCIISATQFQVGKDIYI